MIGNIFPILELMWRMNYDANRNDTNTCNTYTPPRGRTPTREGTARTTAPSLYATNGSNSFFRMENKRNLVNIWKGN